MRVGVDGLNLASAQGNGVATYARTLTSCLRSMGHDVDVLYGMNIPAHIAPDLREILFFRCPCARAGPQPAKTLHGALVVRAEKQSRRNPGRGSAGQRARGQPLLRTPHAGL